MTLALAWLVKNWRVVALGASLAAVLGFVGLSLHWHAQAAQALSELAQARKDLKACSDRTTTLEKQIKSQAIEEGKRYADAEEKARAQCAAAFDAGARKLRDDKAIAAGRYVPKSGPSPTRR